MARKDRERARKQRQIARAKALTASQRPPADPDEDEEDGRRDGKVSAGRRPSGRTSGASGARSAGARSSGKGSRSAASTRRGGAGTSSGPLMRKMRAGDVDRRGRRWDRNQILDPRFNLLTLLAAFGLVIFGGLKAGQGYAWVEFVGLVVGLLLTADSNSKRRWAALNVVAAAVALGLAIVALMSATKGAR